MAESVGRVLVNGQCVRGGSQSASPPNTSTSKKAACITSDTGGECVEIVSVDGGVSWENEEDTPVGQIEVGD